MEYSSCFIITIFFKSIRSTFILCAFKTIYYIGTVVMSLKDVNFLQLLRYGWVFNLFLTKHEPFYVDFPYCFLQMYIIIQQHCRAPGRSKRDE